MDAINDGCLDYVWQIPAGRRLEDRVLDVMRVWQVAVHYSGMDPSEVRLVAPIAGQEPDEFMIASRLLAQGILSSPPAKQA